MFTEGLDSDALKWVKEEKAVGVRDVPILAPNLKRQSDSFYSPRNGGRGFGLPPPTMFRNGQFSSGVSPFRYGDEESGSDMDLSSDSENEIALVSPLKNKKLYNDENKPPLQSSNCTFSDFSSTGESNWPDEGTRIERFGGTNIEYSLPCSGYKREESTDSTFSSEVSSTQVKNNSCIPSYSEACSSDSYLEAGQDFHVNEPQNTKICNDDIPSAPPIYGPDMETNQDAEPSEIIVCNRSAKKVEPELVEQIFSETIINDHTGNDAPSPSLRFGPGAEVVMPSKKSYASLPPIYTSGQDPWCAVISYEACLRLCLHSWDSGCMEARAFLENECELLRNAFGLNQTLLQSEEELMEKRSSGLVCEGAVSKPKKKIGKIKVQVRKVKMGPDLHIGCIFPSLKPPGVKLDYTRFRFSNVKSALSSRKEASRQRGVAPSTSGTGSLAHQCLDNLQTSTQYIKQMSERLKVWVTPISNSSSYEKVQESYSCLLRLTSAPEEDAVPLQPGSGESHVFFPDSLGDDLIIEIQDSKGKKCGRAHAQVAVIPNDHGKNIRWWSIYDDNSEGKLVGKMQVHIDHSVSSNEINHPKWGVIAETVAYDFVLEAALKVQNFSQRNLILQNLWEWLINKFAHYYGVSDTYTKLRYLLHVMSVATPTTDCLTLVHDLLWPVLMKGNSKMTALSHQENRILGEIEDQIQLILVVVFENYKSLDESSPTGIMDSFRPATGMVASVLAPAVNLYSLLNDVLASETQMEMCSYFQAAAKIRSRRHLTDTDEFVSITNENNPMDSVAISTCYLKMKALCLTIRNEIHTDIEIYNQNVLPSFVDLPNLTSSIYNVELCNRLRAFLVACPPAGPTSPVTELVIATADFQRDLIFWNINPVKGGVDAKELFHSCIVRWIHEKRIALLESCKLHKVEWSGIRTQHCTTPFVDNMYAQLMETLNQYEIIICRWPEYIFVLENAIVDVEKEIIGALDRQYADVVIPLKDNVMTKKLGLKYVQKITQRTMCYYTVPDELGILLNTVKRMLDVLRSRIESQLKSWGAYINEGGNEAPGERLGEITVMLRAKYRIYMQAVVEKLAENTKAHNATKLKRIIQDSKDVLVESNVRSKMQPLKELLTNTINQLHTVLETNVFLAICRGLWERMGQEVLTFLETRKETIAWYKGSRVAVSVLDDTFASQMQQLIGNALHQKDVEPPRSIMEVRSILCRDAPNHKDHNYRY